MGKKTPQDGIFITIEGPDGSGKSTQIELLVEFLRARGHRVLVTREPGGTLLGDAVRRLLLEPGVAGELEPETELFLFAAGRAQHVREKIIPAMQAGTVVVASRYADATTAYQGYGRGLHMELVEQVNRLATGGLKPDLTIILDVDSEEGLRRARSTDKDVPSGEVDRIEAAGLDFHERVRRGYHAIAATEPERCCVIEGDGTIDDIAARLRAAVLARFDI